MPDAASPTATAPPEFQVRLSGDKLTMLVTMPDPHRSLEGAAARLALELPPLELAVDVGEDILRDLIAAACAPGEHLVDHPLLTGDPPVPPRDGEIQWQDDYFATGFARDEETNRLDYWERAERRAVTQDQLLAVVLLPRDGIPGRTLQGNEIPVSKPKPVRLRAGKGVRTEELDDRLNLYAAVSGRLSHKDGTVTVDDVYTIRGDVCLETGNVHHTGALVVQGDVKEGARIDCEGDVLVKGLVEPCDIACGGNLTVGGGIVGDQDHRIDVVGSVQARYLNDVILRSGGDVVVTSQIDHSEVETLGKVLIPKGRIAGGCIKAYRGITVGHAGAASATGTVLMPGCDWRLLAKRRDREATIIQLQEIRDQIKQRIDRTVADGVFDDAARQQIEDFKAKLVKIDRALQAAVAAMDEQQAESQRDGVREVAVLAALWSGVTFKLGQATVVSDRNYDLPRLVTLRRDKARILPMAEPDPTV
jgi:uncharacterized protein (DUF342 family)